MALRDFSALAQAVWEAVGEAKRQAALVMIDNTVSSVPKKAALKRQAMSMSISRLDQFAANMMLFNGDAVIK